MIEESNSLELETRANPAALAPQPIDVGKIVLSSLELQTLVLLSKGMSSREIAESIDRKKPTVEGYVRTLCLKFRAKSRVHLIARAYATGILCS